MHAAAKIACVFVITWALLVEARKRRPTLTGHHRWVLATPLLAALLLAAPLVPLAGHAGQFHAAGAPRACE
jgi:hypothetical protein